MEVANLYPCSAVLKKMVCFSVVLQALVTAQSSLLLLVFLSGASLHDVGVVPHPLSTKERFPSSNLEKEGGSEEVKDAAESDYGLDEDDDDDDDANNDDDDDDNTEDDDYYEEDSDDDDGEFDGEAGANGDGGDDDDDDDDDDDNNDDDEDDDEDSDEEEDNEPPSKKKK